MLLQTFDTEEFLADGVFSIPRGSGWMSSEGTKDRRYQVCLSAATTRNFSHQARLVSAICAGIAVRAECATRPKGLDGRKFC